MTDKIAGTLVYAAIAGGLVWIGVRSIQTSVFPGIAWRGLRIDRRQRPIGFWALTLGFSLLGLLIAADIANLWRE